MRFEKEFDELSKAQQDLQVISQTTTPSIFNIFAWIAKLFGLWTSKQSPPKNIKIELVSFKDKAGNEEVTSLVIDGKLVSLEEARELVKLPQYEDTNLGIILKSLDFGTALREKPSTGLKIGSKLYRDNEGTVFADKSRKRAIATVKSDTFYTTQVQNILKEITGKISLNDMAISSDGFAAKLAELNALQGQLKSLDNMPEAHKTLEITKARQILAEKITLNISAVNNIIELDRRISSDIGVIPEQFDFLGGKDPEPEMLDKIAKLTAEIESFVENRESTLQFDKISFDASLISEENQQKVKTLLQEKHDSKDKTPVAEHLIGCLKFLEASIQTLNTTDITVHDIGEFVKSYVDMQDSIIAFKAENNLSSKDLAIFSKVENAIKCNIEGLAAKYSEKLLELDLEHDTTNGTNLRFENEFLNGIANIMPEFESAHEIAEHLIHFAEHIGLAGEGQLSGMAGEVKEKILKHYQAGTLARPVSQVLEEDVRRDKLQRIGYTEIMLSELKNKLSHRAEDGRSYIDLREANPMLDSVFSGDYQMVSLACASLNNLNDPTHALLDDYILHVAQIGSEISHENSQDAADSAKRHNLLEHQLHTAKRDLLYFLKPENIGSIKLSESLAAAKALNLEQKQHDIDLLFLYAAIAEIQLDTLTELEASEDKSLANERQIFARRIDSFVASISNVGLKFLDSPEFRKLGINPKMTEQADIIKAVAGLGFSNFKEVNRSLQKLTLSAKALSSDKILRQGLIKQFMLNDIDLLSREVQHNVNVKLFNIDHLNKDQISALISTRALTNKRAEYYQEMKDSAGIESRSKELRDLSSSNEPKNKGGVGTQGVTNMAQDFNDAIDLQGSTKSVSNIKIGRKLTKFTQMFSAHGFVTTPEGERKQLSKVKDVIAELDKNHQALKQIYELNQYNEYDIQQSSSGNLGDVEAEVKKRLEFERECKSLISGNTKNTMHVLYSAILFGFDQARIDNKELNFSDYLAQMREEHSTSRSFLVNKFDMPKAVKLLFDMEVRSLSSLTEQQQNHRILGWYNDVHIDKKAQKLKKQIDTVSNKIGEDHVFSSLMTTLAPMRAGDEFLIDQSGKITLNTSNQFTKLAQSAVTQGIAEVSVEVALKASNIFKIIKEEQGYSVVFSQFVAANLGLELSVAVGLADAAILAGGGLDKGYKVSFGNSEEQERALCSFVSTVFNDPNLKLEDIARAEAIFMSHGREVKATGELSFGLPSIINSIAVGTGLMQKSETLKQYRDENLEGLAEEYRFGQAAGVAHKVTTETKRGEKVVTQSFTHSVDFFGIAGMEEKLLAMGIKQSMLHSKNAVTIKTSEKYGMITDHVIRSEMTIGGDSVSLVDKSLLALGNLLGEKSVEYDVLMRDEGFKAGFIEKLEQYSEETSPSIILERRIRPEKLTELTAKSHELVSQYGAKEATKHIEKLAESVLNNPANLEISRVLIRSEQRNLRQTNYKTIEVSTAVIEQASEDVAFNRRHLEEELSKRANKESIERMGLQSPTTLDQNIQRRSSFAKGM